MSDIFKYGQDKLTIELSLKLAEDQIEGIITEDTRNKIIKNFQTVQEILNGDKLVYSINTGFGSLCTTKISRKDASKLQVNLLKSHSAGMGNVIDWKIAKLMMILKIHALCKGFSGVSIETIERLMWHVKQNIIPKVPEQGSVGASGDLAPLAHLFSPLIGLGYLTEDGKNYVPSLDILKKHGLKPLELHAKEGLALINGTQFILANAINFYERFLNCLEHADLIGAMSLEGYLGSPQPFNERIIELRPFNGAKIVAKNFRRYLNDSEFVKSHVNCGRVQDPYSIRCIPQVHGASRNALRHLKEVLELELNSVTDNPIIFNDKVAISGGNFHGQPLALPLDYASLAAAELGNISDRRIYLLLEGKWGLPTYLIKETGLNSGFMIAQYCSAALVSENKSACFPASADSIPTSLGQEDHVSMGAISARKALKIVENLEKILAIEMLCAAQAMDFRRPLKSSYILEAVHAHIREKIPHVSEDTVLSELMEKSLEILRSKELLKIIKKLV
ncbi:MAG: histidine ammonia-lyase [Promethearchaeota archaeon]